MMFTENQQYLLVAYDNNSIKKYKINCSVDSQESTNNCTLKKALQIISNPEESIVKPIFPQNKNLLD